MPQHKEALNQADRALNACIIINTVWLTRSHSQSTELTITVQPDSSLCLSQERLVSVTASHIHLSNDKFGV